VGAQLYLGKQHVEHHLQQSQPRRDGSNYLLLTEFYSIHNWKAKGKAFELLDKEMQSGHNYLDHSSSIVADKGLNVLLGHLC
jgi:hypothetical protein